MKGNRVFALPGFFLLLLFIASSPGWAAITVQCPGDTNGDAIWTGSEVRPDNTVCIHLTAGDGFIRMADGYLQYIFGFNDFTGTPPDQVMDEAMLSQQFPAPTIKVKEGQNVYLTLSNVGMVQRPDLFDAHTVHWHGFPFQTPVFDGEPMASISINMGSSLTYYYAAPDPGTYMYHCHFEATEHMQMGMLGNLYVTPRQDDLPDGTVLGSHVHHTGDRYVFNDGDGSTRYDVDYPVQILAFDPRFHDASMNVQPLPFAMMRDTYPMLNGRGYPDTVSLTPPAPPDENGGRVSQPMNSLITASRGQRILLRISSLSTVEFYTLSSPGIPMLVVGKDAKQLPAYFTTNSLTLGGGESYDVILDTADVARGTYFLYTTNLHNLSNDNEDFGGMMTEIVIN